MTGLDWPGLLRAGLRGLGLRPEQFWALTPVELLLMLGLDGAQAPLTRARLAELAAAFPDVKQGDGDGDGGRTQRSDRGAGGEHCGHPGGDGGV